MDIGIRAISSLLHSQGIGDLFRIYLNCRRDDIHFNLAFIPPEFKHRSKEPFDREYMNALYHTCYELAVEGYPWMEAPPFLDDAP